MSQLKQNTLEFLLQRDVIEELLPKTCKEQWQTLYVSADDESHCFTIWCALLNKEAVARAIGHDSWDLRIGDGMPVFSQSRSDSKEVTTYHRFGSCDGLRPFVLCRSFHDAFQDYIEIDEEFRLYHNLAEDKVNGRLLSFDESGREIEVVRVKPKEVSVNLKYLRQFQAGIRWYLAIFIDSIRYSTIPLASVPADELEQVKKDGLVLWRRKVVKCTFKDEFETFSRFLGKVIIAPPSPDKAGIWPFNANDDPREVAFIIGVDENGDEIEHTSAPEKLDNNFDANPGAAHYLTPIFFRRAVLSKYYSEPDRYQVSDGLLKCLSLWSCQIDNDLTNHVVVFLGDLGRDLPYDERLYWRGFNVPPEGRISETNFRRSFLAQFADTQSPDLTFRHEYAETNRLWEEVYGWPLFLAPSSGDSHLLETIRIPVTNSQSELDEQVGCLTKLLVDSLNEREIEKRAGVLVGGTKGIGKLAGFLKKTGFDKEESVVQWLRDLQTLRSTGSAHRKGTGYEKIIAKLGADVTRKPDVVRRLLEEGIVFLLSVRQHYCK